MPAFRCIYSGISNVCSSRSTEEHCLPRGLGKFIIEGSEVTLRDKICEPCNSKGLGPLDNVFLQNSPEALLREAVGQLGRQSHRKKAIFAEATFGVPPITLLWKPPRLTYEILMKLVQTVTGEAELFVLPQVILKDSKEHFYQVYIGPKVKTSDDLEKTVKDRGLSSAQFVSAFSGDTDKSLFQQMLRRYRTRGNRSWAQKFDPGLRSAEKVKVRCEITIHPMYYRALAKIAFHSILYSYPHFSGLESEFEPIKRFIRNGDGDREAFVRDTRHPLFPELSEGRVPSRWGHVVSHSIETTKLKSTSRIIVLGTQSTIVTRMKFFLGPSNIPWTWEVRVPHPGSITVRDARGMAFLYFQNARPADGFHGEVVEMTAATRIMPVQFVTGVKKA